MARILVVDDDAAIRRLVVRGLTKSAHEIEEAGDGRTALTLLDARHYDVVLTDLQMADIDGLDILGKCLALEPSPAVILMSGQGTIDVAVNAVKDGAFDFVEKPFLVTNMLLRIDRALEMRRLTHQIAYLNRMQQDIHRFDHIIGANGSLKRALSIVRKVASSNSTILIRGETGTGKELIAAAVHHNSDRGPRAFVKVNCAALHESLLESELFGHEKGAFTSADRQRAGRFEQADSGTLFLDEIGDMSPSTQSKVLRVLQEHEIKRLGSSRTIKVDVRILAATHRDLSKMVEAGTFREDLFYRLHVVAIDLPALRDRKEDIPALTNTFIERLSRDLKKPVDEVGADVLEVLTRHDWPGNIRELQNVLERAVILADGPRLGVSDVTIGQV